MGLFTKLFGDLVAFVYHCFGLIVIHWLPHRSITTRPDGALLPTGRRRSGHNDLPKLKGHGLLERGGNRYAYRLTLKGVQVVLFLFFHKRLCGPRQQPLSPSTRSPAPT